MKQGADPDALRHIYGRWSTEKLVAAIRVESDQYDPAAIALMKQELDTRDLQVGEVDATLSAIQSERQHEIDRLSRIRGWLAVFILLVIANSVGQLALAAGVAAAGDHWSAWAVAVAMGAPGLFGLYCAWLLIGKQASAPENARRWILWMLATSVGVVVLSGFVLSELVWSLTRAVFGAAIWLVYLSESKRVAFVYRPETTPTGGAEAV